MLAAVKRPAIAIVGRGRLGSALSERLAEAGYPVSEILSRRRAYAGRGRGKPPVRTLEDARLDCDIIWFCVPDAQIRKAASRLAARNLEGKIALHSSGVLGAGALESLRRRGASLASVHPLMTFVKNAPPQLRGVPFAIEGNRRAAGVASRIVRQLGGEVFALKAKDKAAYHAFATLVCPLLLSLVRAAEAVAALAGIPSAGARRRMMPIIRQTLRNYETLGPARAFTGPIARGDLETIRSHLAALAQAPPAKEAYLALARAALEYLPGAKPRRVAALLKDPGRQTGRRSGKGTSRANRRSAARN